MKTLFIRADAGGATGTGHVMRMLALAQGRGDRFSVFGDRWAGDRNPESGVRSQESANTSSVVFISACLPKALEQRLQSEGFEVVRIEAEPGSKEDVQATLAVVGSRSSESDLNASGRNQSQSSTTEHRPPTTDNWLITDGYHFDYAYQKAIKTAGISLLCVDDHGYSARWCCDAILNQNLDAEKRCRYDNDVPGAKYLLGSDYCLLRREFLQAPVERIPRGRIERLLVTLGGSDPENATGATLRLLNAACERSLTIRVLAGVDNPILEQLKAFASHHTIEVLTKVTDMPAQYAWADGIISAGGSTCWEWLYVGLPGAIVTIAENQLPIVKALTETRRTAISLGWFQKLAADARGSSLATWLEAPRSVADQDAAEALIDGFGAFRVSEFLLSQLIEDVR